jgi:uroporphyrin-III C-methyltransferase
VGVSKLPADARALREAGMDPGTPAAMVERATWPDARVAEGTIDTIVDVRDSR